MSVALLLLLGAFFLSALIGALERSRKMLAISAACCVAVACVVVFLSPLRLPPVPAAEGATTTTAVLKQTRTSQGGH
jgi:predicted branched-subunit amino acid permease